MKKTLALLLAIGGTTSFAGRDLEKKKQELTSAENSLCVSTKELTSLKKSLINEEINIDKLKNRQNLLSELITELKALLSPEPLDEADPVGQLKKRINLVDSQNFYDTFYALTSEYANLWRESSAKPVVLPLAYPAITDAKNFIDELKGHDLTWIKPFLEKTINHASIPSKVEKEFFTEQQTRQTLISLAINLHKYIREFVTHPSFFNPIIIPLNKIYEDIQESVDEKITIWVNIANSIHAYRKAITVNSDNITRLNEEIQQLEQLEASRNPHEKTQAEIASLKKELDEINSIQDAYTHSAQRNKTEYEEHSRLVKLNNLKKILKNYEKDLKDILMLRNEDPSSEWLTRLKTRADYLQSDTFTLAYYQKTFFYINQWKEVTSDPDLEDFQIKDSSIENLKINDLSINDSKEPSKIQEGVFQCTYTFNPRDNKLIMKILEQWNSTETTPVWLNSWIDERNSKGATFGINDFFKNHKEWARPTEEQENLAMETYDLVERLLVKYDDLFRRYLYRLGRPLETEIKKYREFMNDIHKNKNQDRDKVRTFENRKKQLVDKIKELENSSKPEKSPGSSHESVSKIIECPKSDEPSLKAVPLLITNNTEEGKEGNF